jgi:hypothetical protein
MEPFCWRRAFFLGFASSAASLVGLVFDTFVPVLLQAGHPLWHNDMGLHAPLVAFALAPSLAFFIMTWDNLINIVVHTWTGVRSDHAWTRWGRRKLWILVGIPLAVTGIAAARSGWGFPWSWTISCRWRRAVPPGWRISASPVIGATNSRARVRRARIPQVAR